MVSVLSLLIPIALSAVFVFIASSIIHMATPWHRNDLMTLPNEDGVMNALPFGPGTEYLRIMQVAGCVGFTGYGLAQAHESIWWGRRWSWTLRNKADNLPYGWLTGGTFGWLWPR